MRLLRAGRPRSERHRAHAMPEWRVLTMTDITPIILAAGDSSRMGGFPKALLPLGSVTFLTRILETLSYAGLHNSWVVLGSQESTIRPLLGSTNARALVNPEPERGQFSSLRLALENLQGASTACLIWPVDQPMVSAALVMDLARLFERSCSQLAMPRFQGRPGHPAIFGARLIAELLCLPLEANPKVVVEKYKSGAAWLDTDEAGVLDDIDTPEDYYRATGETLASALKRSGTRLL
jgi:molybdenum cofactor cytidylyltransferase